jgi:hypothetical protein
VNRRPADGEPVIEICQQEHDDMDEQRTPTLDNLRRSAPAPVPDAPLALLSARNSQKWQIVADMH